MTVASPKTEHIEGKEYRVCPIFGRLRPFLEEARRLAPQGEVYVVGGKQGDAYRATAQKPGGWVNTNLRTTFEKIVRRAGLTAWPRLFQALRASCETDLMQDHPIHVVTAWIGNTPKIALGHYLQTLEADFAKAVRGDATDDARATRIPTQSGAATSERERPEPAEPSGKPGVPPAPDGSCSLVPDCPDGQGGTRTTRRIDYESQHFRTNRGTGGAESGAVAGPRPDGRVREFPHPRPKGETRRAVVGRNGRLSSFLYCPVTFCATLV